MSAPVYFRNKIYQIQWCLGVIWDKTRVTPQEHELLRPFLVTVQLKKSCAYRVLSIKIKKEKLEDQYNGLIKAGK